MFLPVATCLEKEGIIKPAKATTDSDFKLHKHQNDIY